MSLFSAIDLLFVLSAALGFVVFLVAHVVGFRTLKTDSIGGTVVASFVWGLAATLAMLVWVVTDLGAEEIAAVPALTGAVIAILIYGMLFFNYMSLVFGMGEVAIRVRLLRELANHPHKAATAEEICAGYNKRTILLPRLDRLVTAGHLRFDGTHYRVGRRVLFLQANALRWIGTLMGVQRKY